MSRKNIALVALRYPYGKDQIYLNGSLMGIGARLVSEYDIEFVDFNIDRIEDRRVEEIFVRAEIIGVTVTGAPYIPGAIEFAQRMALRYPAKPILIGGQGIKVTPAQFAQLFRNTQAVQVSDDETGLNRVLGRQENLSDIYHVPFSALWEQIDEDRRCEYFSNEFSILISQGCKYQCHFCGAEKKQQETFVDLSIFKTDLSYLADQARRFGIPTLRCYATSLDFFQNPKMVNQYLEALAEVQERTGVRFEIRCLSCMKSFIAADREIPNIGQLLHRAGLTSIGFGLDGVDPSVWKTEGKWQNEMSHIPLCLDRCQEISVQTELLFIVGFGKQTAAEEQTFMDHNLRFALEVFEKWPSTVFRPYLAKNTIPGNRTTWDAGGPIVDELLRDPKKFLNLDFAAYPSSITHPDPEIRQICHDGFKKLVDVTTEADRCYTYPLYPQGEDGAEGERNALLNTVVEFDR